MRPQPPRIAESEDPSVAFPASQWRTTVASPRVERIKRRLLENVRQRVNAMEDVGSIRVIGYYSTEYRGSTKEYGFLDLKMIAFYDEETGKEVAYFTDPQDSQFYSDSDVTVIFAPGHHNISVYYPRYVSPWWDSDGDGIGPGHRRDTAGHVGQDLQQDT